MTVSLVTRHRWLGDARYQRWTCTAGVPSLYASPDPLCPGCSVEIRWSETPRVERFIGVSRGPLLAEDLAVRLDLYVIERHLVEARRVG